MELWFENKVALVTGGGAGIGRAACLLYAGRGAKVVVTDVNLESAHETVELIKSAGGDSMALGGNVTSDAAVASFVGLAIEKYGRLDCAFNNAGVTFPGDSEWDDDIARKTVDVNVFGVMSCIKHEIKAMLANNPGGGTIVNTSSLGGLVASRTVFNPAYTASKHGVIGLTKSAALQYARKGIRVNAICPGVTMTNMVRQVMETSPEVRLALEEMCPLGRIADPMEIAEAAVWLSSSKSSFVNGHALVVDGGSAAE